MSSKDLCMIQHLDELADAGIDSFKIEGRMKGVNYVAGVVKTYREAVDSLEERPYKVREEWLRELSMFSNRGYTTGVFLGRHPDNSYNHDEEEGYRMSHELVGIVESVNDGQGLVALRNLLRIGDNVEFLSRGLENSLFEIRGMNDQRGNPVESGRNEERVTISVPKGVRENDLIRRPVRASSLLHSQTG